MQDFVHQPYRAQDRLSRSGFRLWDLRSSGFCRVKAEECRAHGVGTPYGTAVDSKFELVGSVL